MYKVTLAILLLSMMFTPLLQAETITLSPEPHITSSKRVGQLNFYRTYQYSFKSTGQLTTLNVDVGDQFKKGQLLAAVDTDDLNSELNQLLAEKKFVNEEVKRLTKLKKQNAVAVREVEKLKAQSSQLKAAITRVRDYLSAAIIKAPYDGVVLMRTADLGEWVAPGQLVLEVAPIENNLVVSVSVSETEVSNLSYGADVEIVSRSDGKASMASVKKVSATPNVQTGLFSVDLAIEPMSDMIIGKMFDVSVSQNNEFVFRIPVELASVDFNKTALVKVMDEQNQPALKRFQVVGYDLDNVFVSARDYSQLTLIK